MMLIFPLSFTNHHYHEGSDLSKRRVTLKDIAHRANVSAQTVSRVMNNSPEVSVETRQRIRDLALEMGYHPNIIARSLVTHQTGTIGVMVSSLDYYGPNFLLVGIEEEARTLGYSLTLSILPEPRTADIELSLRSLLDRQVDGILWVVPEIAENYNWWDVNTPGVLDVPIVFMERQPGEDYSVVSCDYRYGGRLATHHLLENGCRNVAIITANLDVWEGSERYAGWRDALLDAGIQPTDRQVYQGNWFPKSGYNGLLQLQNQFPEMDGLFVCADHMALGVLQAAAENNIDIPGELPIVGFDDWSETAYYHPALTTIHKPFKEIGGLAMRELHRQIITDTVELQKDPPKTILMRPYLVVRKSCGTG
jgi:DNA-binding LacI/PurR family transcriptional regulator